jgi:hypothetical protein
VQQTPRSPLGGEHARHLARGEGEAALPRQACEWKSLRLMTPSPFPPCDLRSFARTIAAGSPLPHGERRIMPLRATYPRIPNLHYSAITSSSEGRHREALRRRDGVRRPAGSCTQHEHSGGIGAPPGTTRSPCQELADDLGVALPASGLLERDALTGKRGPMPQTSAIGAPRGARRVLPKDADTIGFALFGAPPPHKDEGK